MQTEKLIRIGNEEYIIKRWKFKEKIELYKRAAKLDRSGRIKELDIGEFMINAIVLGVKEPQLTREDVENMDAAVAERLFNEIIIFNAIPFQQ
ncbi:hypothetical protein DRJ17_04480 [Candidatus Woesearchaeota archaeon]|nr:MAG: hypothetical protein DRJ17_04480 [Candidatus Woesearchaeota archaeon]